MSAVVFLAAGCGKTQQASNPPSGQQQLQQPAGQDRVKIISVFQTVQASNFNQPGPYNIEEGKSTLDLLKTTHQVVAKSYGDMGEFVESIDGIKPDSQHFWAFYLNDQSSDIGASSYVLKDGDRVAWKMEAIK